MAMLSIIPIERGGMALSGSLGQGMGLKQLPATYADQVIWGQLLSSLSNLDLSANQLNSVDVLVECTALTDLDISSNDIDEL